MSARAIDYRVEIGRLHPIHPGVYAVGHPRVSYRGELNAAILACGPLAVLSHRTAASEWDLIRSSSRRIHLTVPQSRKSVPGLTLHRVRELPGDQRRERDGLPLTSVERTLIDIAATATPRELERALEQAVRLQIFDFRRLRDLLHSARTKRGTATLRAIFAAHHPESARTKQELERLFFQVCRDAGFPLPVANASVAGYEVDAYWPDHDLVAELDGFESHGGSRLAFEDDHVKTAALQLAGLTVVRVTWRMLDPDPSTVVALLQARFGRPLPAAARR